MKIIKELLTLAKTGNVVKEKRSFTKTLIFIAMVFAILVILKFFAHVLSYLLEHYDLYEKPTRVGLGKARDFSPQKLLTIVLFSPLIEELALRIGLRFSKWNLIIMSIALPLSLLKLLFKTEWLSTITISVSIGLSLFFMLKNKNLFDSTKRIWSTNKKVIFYFSLFVFAFLHLNKYDITMTSVIFVLLAFVVIILIAFGIKRSDRKIFDILAYSIIGVGLLTGLFFLWFMMMFGKGYGV